MEEMAKIYLDEKQALLLKSCLNNPTLSWQAKGLYTYIVGMGDCDIKVSYLIKQSKGGRDLTRKLMRELEDKGYILTEQLRDPDNGQFSGYAYLPHRIPELLKEKI
jgi:hypothetical protein